MLHPPRRIPRRAAEALLSQSRTYAISVKPPKPWPGKNMDARLFNADKTFLYQQFISLLGRSTGRPLLFLWHKNFKANAMAKMRGDIHAAALPKGSPSLSMTPLPPAPESMPQFSVLQTSVFGVALRHFAPLDQEAIEQIASMVTEGNLAVLSLSGLDPPILHAVIRALERAVPRPPKQAESPSPLQSAAVKLKGKAAGTEDEGFVPGRRQKRRRPILTPELRIAGALIEGRVFGVEALKNVAQLPTLETLRAQIVGLISSPAVQLAMVLGEASGGRLARTLEGLKKGMEESADA